MCQVQINGKTSIQSVYSQLTAYYTTYRLRVCENIINVYWIQHGRKSFLLVAGLARIGHCLINGNNGVKLIFLACNLLGNIYRVIIISFYKVTVRFLK